MKQIIQELKFEEIFQTKLFWDNQYCLQPNHSWEDHTYQVNDHFTGEMFFGCIVTDYISTDDKLAYIPTGPFRGPRIGCVCNKLSAYNLCASIGKDVLMYNGR